MRYDVMFRLTTLNGFFICFFGAREKGWRKKNFKLKKIIKNDTKKLLNHYFVGRVMKINLDGFVRKRSLTEFVTSVAIVARTAIAFHSAIAFHGARVSVFAWTAIACAQQSGSAIIHIAIEQLIARLRKETKKCCVESNWFMVSSSFIFTSQLDPV